MSKNNKVPSLEEAMQLLVGQTIKRVKVRRDTMQDDRWGPLENQVAEVMLVFENDDVFDVSVAVDSKTGLHCSTMNWECC